MGVINITPNSFSDGGNFNNPNNFFKHANYLIDNGVDILDLGAESSAPMNKAITINEEISRFDKNVLPVLDQLPNKIQISIDTYKIETIQYLLSKPCFEKYYNDELLIWNDVSGQTHDIKALMNKYPKLKYIHCHNLVDDRSKTLDHMDYSNSELSLKSFFNGSPHLLDPCFGFSKTRQQNFELWKRLSGLISTFHENTWVIGISRKSFLRFLDLDKSDPVLITQTEIIQAILLKELIVALSNSKHKIDLIFRMHDPNVFKSIKSSFKFNET